MKRFNTTGLCIPEKHYMVDISATVAALHEMVDDGKYFTINRGRQYGKTTTLFALEKALKGQYEVLSLDFQDMSAASFSSEKIFCKSMSRIILDAVNDFDLSVPAEVVEDLRNMKHAETSEELVLGDLFSVFRKWCGLSEKPVVLFIDEVDSASNNQLFLDFLAQLRADYLKRERNDSFRTFRSVILAGVTDIKNLKRKIRPDEESKVNSPWNIAVDFKLDMSLSADGIAGMLKEYADEHALKFDVQTVAEELRAYTGGYPFLVSRLCQMMDGELSDNERFAAPEAAWSVEGVSEAVRRILMESNTLFDSLMGKVNNNAGLRELLWKILFSGKDIAFNPDELPLGDSIEYGLVKDLDGRLVIANRVFETRLYNFYLSTEEAKESPMFQLGRKERIDFVKNGGLDMDLVLSRFVTCFDDIYGELDEKFDEEEGRRRFLLFLRPIINGTGNYYIEAQTRDAGRMDVVVDYLGERFVVELKIWRGNAYNTRGEKQLNDYLNYFHINKEYMLSFCFNKNKQTGLKEVKLGDKLLVEAVV